MNVLKRFTLLNIWFLILISSTTRILATPITTVQASEYPVSIPVLKGLKSNPVLKIVIAVPAGKLEQEYKKLECQLNTAAVKNIDKIEVYVTGAEPFSTNKLIGSIRPTSSTCVIPISLKQVGGVNFIWLSVVLNSDANINTKIELHCKKIIANNNNSILVRETKGNYVKNCGDVLKKGGDGGINTFRIPGIAQTDKGTLISVYDIRYSNSGDLPGNIDVGMSRSTDMGNTWEPMKVIMDMGAPHENNGVGDPAILFDPVTKKIFVVALWSKGNRSIAGSLPGLAADTTGQFVIASSSDDGATWSPVTSITPQVKNPAWHIFFNGPGSGIAMQDGKLVFAAQYWDEVKKPYSTIIYSDDHGSTWIGKIVGPKSNTTESQVVETTPGTLMLNMRDNRGYYRSIATTTNMGNTWVEDATSYNALPDPVCMGSIIKAQVKVKGILKDVLFFSNPNTTSGRYNITIKASLDLGKTWQPANEFLVDERQCYGYSSLTKVDDNTIGILYEGTKDLYFVKVGVSSIIK